MAVPRVNFYLSRSGPSSQLSDVALRRRSVNRSFARTLVGGIDLDIAGLAIFEFPASEFYNHTLRVAAF